MAPVGFIFATSALLAASGNSDSAPADGVPFGAALLIASGSAIGLFAVPIILYATVSSLVRRCKERRARRQDARRETKTRTTARASAEPRGTRSWPGWGRLGCGGRGGAGCAATKTTESTEGHHGVGGANGCWLGSSPANAVEGGPIGTVPDGQTKTIAGPTLPYIWKTTSYKSPAGRPRGMMLPWTWMRTKRSNGNSNGRDYVRGEETAEEKEHIVAAFVGFLRSWARVEGDGRS
jgi:hypothetical protein